MADIEKWRRIHPSTTQPENEMTKTINMYEVRYFPSGSAVSQRVGKKCRLLHYRKAQAVVRRMRQAGVDATIGSPWRIRVAA